MNNIFPSNFFYHYRAPNAEEFISALDKIEPSEEKFPWQVLCNIKTTRLTSSDYAKYLFPSFDLLMEDIEKNSVVQCQKQFIVYDPWINFYGKGSYQETHDHPRSDIACVFFINEGENFSEFYFWDRNYMLIPDSWRIMLNLKNHFFPEVKKGDIIFFPSHCLHGVTQHNSDIVRKTFSCNVSLELSSNK